MKKILIVDDIKGWREYHSSIISTLFDDSQIITAESGRDGYNKIIEHNDKPFDIIITDLQMENDFEPKLAGEWLVEQIQTFKSYAFSRIVIISASYIIRNIADGLNVDFITKSTARNFPDSYNFLKD